MIVKPLHIRERVELRLPQSDEAGVFRLRVQEISPQGIYLDRPVIDRRHFNAVPGDPVDIEYKRPDAIYRFTSKLVEFARTREIPAMLIEHPHEVRRTQRREHFRIDVLLTMHFRLHNPDESAEEMPRAGWVLNLSAGGMQFGAQAADTLDIWAGTMLDLEVILSNETELKGLWSQVLQIGADPHDHSRSVAVCRFMDIQPKIREAIIVHNIRYQQRWRTEPSEQA